MKKHISVLILLTLVTAGAFAQFSIGAQVSTFEDIILWEKQNVSSSGNNVLPGIYVSYGLDKLDILGNINFFWATKHEEQWDTVSFSNVPLEETMFLIGIKAGVAPKLAVSDKVTFSLPILAGFAYNSFESSVPRPAVSIIETMKSSQIKISLEVGGRANYALSKELSLYMGFNVNLLSYFLTQEISGFNEWGAWQNEHAPDIRILRSGNLVFGFKYSF